MKKPETTLIAALKDLGPDYKPRTKHLNPDGSPRFINRLIHETSPYLLQHAHNPVTWQAWGDEAFAEAKALGRPVLLSIGYATCHWCHVMEEESFEDEAIAQIINDHYVAIKVDREERPDVDAIYMAAVQALTGHGGWPMTVWMTADRKPFYAGTYFPPYDGARGARVGFARLLAELAHVFHKEPEKITAASTDIVKAVTERLAAPTGGDYAPGLDLLERAWQFYQRSFDRTHGGMTGAPKFPSSMPSRLMLRLSARFGKPEALAMAVKTLTAMADGGINDQIGGGFHRYSVDDEWLVPHFEKMLYDNALLADAYTEAWQATGDAKFRNVATATLNYVLREMTAEGGGFYSATDADSPNPEKRGEREEGWFFTWTPGEFKTLLGTDADAAINYFALTNGGNYEGRNVLSVPDPRLPLPPGVIAKLLAERVKRPPPLTDDKQLTAWNGLMIGALARGGFILDEPRYIAAAARAADFILRELVHDGRLRRTYKRGEAKLNAYLDDYAAVIGGLLELFQADGNKRWLEAALSLTATLNQHYSDHDNGGYFMISDDHEALLVREKPLYDGAEPSGNSRMAQNLLRLDLLTSDDRFRVQAEGVLKGSMPVLSRMPAALAEMLLALDLHLSEPTHVVIVCRNGRDDARPMLDALRKRFLPHAAVTVVTPANHEELSHLLPTIRDRHTTGLATAYVCQGTQCGLPATDVAGLIDQLDGARA